MRWSLVLFFLAGILIACNPLPPDGQLSFHSIEKKLDSAFIGQQQYAALNPGILVINDMDDVEAEGIWFSEKARKILRGLNFNSQIALAAFRGWQSTEGYGVEIERISRHDNVVQVHASFITPTRENQKTGLVTSPYHLVWVRKAGIWHDAIQYELVVDGEVLAVYPTPEP